MPTLTIDNQKITVPEGKTVLEAAEELGIQVPHFCYHKELGAVGACRMCAVTVQEGSSKGLKMSCLIPAEDGMVVTTDDEQSTTFRDRVGEWLMLNHPHDCPVCDEGGECQLQEMTIASGHGVRRYAGQKRTYNNQDLGPFVAQEMNRCIQCYRCVRTYQDYCGGRDFGVMGSRNRVFFGRFQDGTLESDFSGNIVDVCPTGVLTDKTYRFKSRYWDLQEAPSVCPHCSLGCATIPGGRFHELQRVRSGENQLVNGFFICDRGRFGSGYVNHPERPRQARNNEQLIGMDEALRQLDVEARGLIEQHGPEAVLLLGSERTSLEANWLLQQWAKKLGCREPVLAAHGPRHQAAQVVAFDLSDRLASLEQVRGSDLVLVAGADPLAEAPMLAVALRQVVRSGGQVIVYDPRPVELPCEFDHQALSPLALLDFLTAGGSDGQHVRELLQHAESPILVGGADLLGVEGLQRLKKMSLELSNDQRPCLIYPLLSNPNSFGAALLSLPEQDDLLTRLETGRVKMLVCLESDPLLEAPESDRFSVALTKLDKLVVLDYLPTPLSVHANLFIPTRTPVESDGTFINNEGRLRSYAGVLEPGLPISVAEDGGHPPREFSTVSPGSDPLSASRILQILLKDDSSLVELHQQMVADFPRLAGLTGLTPSDAGVRVADAAARNVVNIDLPEQPVGTLQLIVSPARYGSDLLSRYSDKLEPRFSSAWVMMNSQDAAERGLQEGDKVILDTETGSFCLPMICHPQLAAGCALVENSAALASLVPGAGISYCEVSREVSHE
ncbi:MAG: NADH-quinone oxidoreductase subunit NuoG [Desulfuromusa sp.]|jgi:NADH-quinone oxidoreductase subunit G|nr:NADH-quinone oxidoreductase subunit NuoG [Desulfuromusa sp.]